jgi:hypothetical protein
MDIESRATIDEGIDRIHTAGEDLLSHATSDIPVALAAVVAQLDKVLEARLAQFQAATRAESEYLVESIRSFFPIQLGVSKGGPK